MSKVSLPEYAEIVIIGGGVAGASLAMRLTERGVKDILVLEKKELASGSTHKAAGIISHASADLPRTELARMWWPTLDFFRDQGDFEFHRLPLFVPLRQGDPAEIKEYIIDAVINGWPGMEDLKYSELLDLEQCKKVMPDIRLKNIRNLGDLENAIYSVEAWIDPYQLCMTYVKYARQKGAIFKTRVEVTDIITKGGKVEGVVTTAGKVRCKYLVNCCGAWSSKIGDMVGIKIPVFPVRRLAIKINPKKEKDYDLGAYLDELESITPRMGLWIRTDIGGYLGAGTHNHISTGNDVVDPDDYNESAEFEDIADFADKLDTFLPGFGEFDVIEGNAGLYEVTPDGSYIIDKVKELENFILFTGLCGEGIQASGSGSILAAELILDGEIKCVSDPSMWAYNRQRFPEL